MGISEHRSLPVRLTPTEFDTRSAELAAAVEACNVAKAEAKAEASRRKTILDGLEEDRNRLATVVRDREEYRQVLCEWSKDWDRKMMICVRTDTGEIVTSRDMTQEERQLQLGLVLASEGGER